jgi:RHS repeat-associated protein
MLSGLGGKIMEYDGENRPLSVTYLGKKTCYVYGVDGKRLKKVEGLSPATLCTALPPAANGTTYFGPVEVRNWLGAEQVLTYPQPSVKLTNGVATWLHFDHLGSVRAITDATGAKVESAIYRPFGEQSEWLQPGTPAPETKGWIGERYDADAGLQYLNARYYDPALGLFLQPDWFEVTKPGVGTNRFSYSFNDPVNKIDPGGNACTAMGDCGLPGEYIPGFDDFNPVAEPETTAAMAAMALAPVAMLAAPEIGMVLGTRAMAAAPKATTLGLEIGVAEATGMTVGVGAAASTAKTVESVWNSPAIPRGNIIEKILDANLPRSFPVVDRFLNGVVTSIKSLDLRAPTYQNAGNLERTLTGYVDKVIDFTKAERQGVELEQGITFTGKALEIAIPGAPNAMQQGVIDRIIDYGNINSINVFTTILD